MQTKSECHAAHAMPHTHASESPDALLFVITVCAALAIAAIVNAVTTSKGK